MVTEPLKMGRLDAFLPQQRLELAIIRKFALDICEALIYLARRNFVHWDVAARNVYLTEGYQAKLGNFGLRKHHTDRVEDGWYTRPSGVAVMRWSPPEVASTEHRQRQMDHAEDVWCYGFFLYEMLTKAKLPYNPSSWSAASKAHRTMKEVQAGSLLPKPSRCTDELYDIMADCWDINPRNRPPAHTIKTRLLSREALQQLDQVLAGSPGPGMQAEPLYAGGRQGPSSTMAGREAATRQLMEENNAMRQEFQHLRERLHETVNLVASQTGTSPDFITDSLASRHQLSASVLSAAPSEFGSQVTSRYERSLSPYGLDGQTLWKMEQQEQRRAELEHKVKMAEEEQRQREQQLRQQQELLRNQEDQLRARRQAQEREEEELRRQKHELEQERIRQEQLLREQQEQLLEEQQVKLKQEQEELRREHEEARRKLEEQHQQQQLELERQQALLATIKEQEARLRQEQEAMMLESKQEHAEADIMPVLTSSARARRMSQNKNVLQQQHASKLASLERERDAFAAQQREAQRQRVQAARARVEGDQQAQTAQRQAEKLAEENRRKAHAARRQLEEQRAREARLAEQQRAEDDRRNAEKERLEAEQREHDKIKREMDERIRYERQQKAALMAAARRGSLINRDNNKSVASEPVYHVETTMVASPTSVTNKLRSLSPTPSKSKPQAPFSRTTCMLVVQPQVSRWHRSPRRKKLKTGLMTSLAPSSATADVKTVDKRYSLGWRCFGTVCEPPMSLLFHF
eukprot:TRINITY_DN10233_c0_g1_i6.p1 TRINITY_DN10233_c0_g1~~TRINITY_DN10233_c0_g1_i6.p1  ORF type:complete len:855 (+),score=206.96 TRINITY_DN10233_c0_g1_i6:320-2566(+)